jgi:hypothetical protein
VYTSLCVRSPKTARHSADKSSNSLGPRSPSVTRSCWRRPPSYLFSVAAPVARASHNQIKQTQRSHPTFPLFFYLLLLVTFEVALQVAVNTFAASSHFPVLCGATLESVKKLLAPSSSHAGAAQDAVLDAAQRLPPRAGARASHGRRRGLRPRLRGRPAAGRGCAVLRRARRGRGDPPQAGATGARRRPARWCRPSRHGTRGQRAGIRHPGGRHRRFPFPHQPRLVVRQRHQLAELRWISQLLETDEHVFACVSLCAG